MSTSFSCPSVTEDECGHLTSVVVSCVYLYTWQHQTHTLTHALYTWRSSIIVSICPWNKSHFSQLCPPALGYDLLTQTTNILVLSTQPSGILYSNLASRVSLWSDIFAQWKLNYNWPMVSFFSHNFYKIWYPFICHLVSSRAIIPIMYSEPVINPKSIPSGW